MPTARSPAAATYPLPRLLRKSARTGSIIGRAAGGATLSGGEPLLQAEGAALLAKSLRSEGTEVLIDTAGCVPFSAFEKVMPYTNGFLFDVKACTEEDYARIGGEFFLVRDNFGKLTKAGANVRARVPLIPNFNDGKKYCEKMCAFLRSLGAEKVDLLPFHRMAAPSMRRSEKLMRTAKRRLCLCSGRKRSRQSI